MTTTKWQIRGRIKNWWNRTKPVGDPTFADILVAFAYWFARCFSYTTMFILTLFATFVWVKVITWFTPTYLDPTFVRFSNEHPRLQLMLWPTWYAIAGCLIAYVILWRAMKVPMRDRAHGGRSELFIVAVVALCVVGLNRFSTATTQDEKIDVPAVAAASEPPAPILAKGPAKPEAPEATKAPPSIAPAQKVTPATHAGKAKVAAKAAPSKPVAASKGGGGSAKPAVKPIIKAVKTLPPCQPAKLAKSSRQPAQK